MFGLLLLIERKVKLRRGYMFGAYAALHTFGRFWTEYLRIDPAHRYLGLRFNDWTSVAVFAVSSVVLLLIGRPKPGDELVGDELPPALLAEERARASRASNEETRPLPVSHPSTQPLENRPRSWSTRTSKADQAAAVVAEANEPAVAEQALAVPAPNVQEPDAGAIADVAHAANAADGG